MPRLLFEKKGNAVWISHLDLMRLFQRSFKRAGLPLTHTRGFNPRPSVSIALPLSVGVESFCEILDFDLDGSSVPCDEIRDKQYGVLVEGVKVLDVYEDGRKIKNLALLDCVVTLEYDAGVPSEAVSRLEELFSSEEVLVEKKAKSGEIKEQNIISMIRNLEISQPDGQMLELRGRICCQNPTLNPMQMVAAIGKYLPDLKPDFAKCARLEGYDNDETIFR